MVIYIYMRVRSLRAGCVKTLKVLTSLEKTDTLLENNYYLVVGRNKKLLLKLPMEAVVFYNRFSELTIEIVEFIEDGSKKLLQRLQTSRQLLT